MCTEISVKTEAKFTLYYTQFSYEEHAEIFMKFHKKVLIFLQHAISEYAKFN